MKSTVILIMISITLNGCVQRSYQQNTYVSSEEKLIIDNMDCWKSASAESILTIIAFEDDEKKKEARWDEWNNEQNEATQKGQSMLYNDTAFIDIIRNDSIYNALLAERKSISSTLSKYRNISFFRDFITKIKNDIVEYNYYRGGYNFGIYENAFKKEHNFFDNNKFYKNYSDLLKEGYSLSENLNVNEDDVINLNNILKSLEILDRKLWAVKYFRESKNEIEKKNLEQKKANRVDSLFNQ